jgi:flagellin FlaB
MTYILPSDKGAMGVSTLIIFIAVVLIAASAAGVIISTSSKLQQSALKKSDEAEDAVGSSFNVMYIQATDGSDGSIEDFEILMKLQAGSSPIHFNYTLVSVSTGAWNQIMEYNGSGTSAVGTTMYWVEWVKQGPDYQLDYLNRGDLVKLRFHSGSSLGEAKKVKLRITPKNGFVNIIEFTTPMRIKETKLNLYPLAI